MKSWVLMLSMVVLLGCGSGGTEVSGKVAFEDGAPLTKGVVMYLGPTGTFQGIINADGTYAIENVVAGQYQVVITGADEGDDSPDEMQYDKDGNYIESAPKKRTPLISARFTNADKSGISKTVPGDYDIQVEKP